MTKHEMNELGYRHYSEKGNHAKSSDFHKNFKRLQEVIQPHVLKDEAVRARRGMRRIPRS